VKMSDTSMREASAILDRLVLEKVIEAVKLRFTRSQTVIHVTINPQDELSVARVRRQVRTVLEPFLARRAHHR
jgi:hypothetical protein